ncbi:MAG: hypothetical protein KKE17_05575 [Proteobacteria bacterium]|nr:hypothetical protein [Pseudomonadota bacterium]MBU1709461.1 hypothetical protein [Pseudomonadota bacterium]
MANKHKKNKHQKSKNKSVNLGLGTSEQGNVPVKKDESANEDVDGEKLTGLCHKTLSPPFYTLRNFLDAEYGVILGYGFYHLAEQLVLLKNIFRTSHLKFPEKFFLALDDLILNHEFWTEIGSLVFMITLFVILVDDYARGRLINYLAPCRTIGRFGLDVIIPFFFGLGFLLISEKSSFMFFSIGIAFFVGALWSNRVIEESYEWQEIFDQCILPTRSSSNEKNHLSAARIEDESGWLLYRNRLKYIIRSHLCYGFLLLASTFYILIVDIHKEHWLFYSVALLLSYWLFETLRFKAEVGFVLEVDEKTTEKYPAVMKTIVWIPRICHILILDKIFKKK